jgi:hypothetical protein
MFRIMNARSCIAAFVAALVAFATFGTGAASAATKDKNRLFVGIGYQTGLVTDPCLFTVRGPMIGNLIGAGTLTSSQNGDCSPAGFSEFITAANGDKLVDFFEPSVYGDPTTCHAVRGWTAFTSFTATGNFVPGGTGRFANASSPANSLHSSGCYYLNNDPNAPANFLATFIYAGPISY